MGVVFEKDTDDMRRYLSELDGQMRAFDRDMTRLGVSPDATKRPTAGQMGSWIGIYYGPRTDENENDPVGWRSFYEQYTSLLTMPLVFTDLDRVFAQAEAFEFKMLTLRKEVGEANMTESKDSPPGPDFDTQSSTKKAADALSSVLPMAVIGLSLFTFLAVLRRK